MSFHVSLSLFLSVLLKALRMFVCVFMNWVTRRVRIANQMVMDSYCRGGIVNIVNTRFGRSCAHLARPDSPKALWRFRASTSNSLIGRSRLPMYTQIRHIYQTYAQQDTRVCEGDHFEPPP